jgi:2,3-bisphosphoglycerate-dependent phosphoglycerate mutase
MELYIIRHAQSENNALWARTGSSIGRVPDPLLTETGQQQARCLAEHISTHWQETTEEDLHNRNGYHFTHLYTSFMLRSIITGSVLAERVNLPLVAWEIIHEMGGMFDHKVETDERIGIPGPDRTYFAQHYPHLVLPDSLGEAGWWEERPFETSDQVMLRAKAFLEELQQRHGPSDRVAMITHGGFIVALLRTLFGFTTLDNSEKGNRIWVHASNTSLTRLDFYDDRVGLVYLNRVDHLPADLVT